MVDKVWVEAPKMVRADAADAEQCRRWLLAAEKAGRADLEQFALLRYFEGASQHPDEYSPGSGGIPCGMVDDSWGNDACPSYVMAALPGAESEGSLAVGLLPYAKLWVDHVEEEERELAGCRYTLDLSDEWTGNRLPLFESEDIAPVVVYLVALQFSLRLRQAIGASGVAYVNRMNRVDRDGNVCHSHDKCDANDLMLQAMRDVFGWTEEFDPGMPDGIHGLWEAAWAAARSRGFFGLEIDGLRSGRMAY